MKNIITAIKTIRAFFVAIYTQKVIPRIRIDTTTAATGLSFAGWDIQDNDFII